MEQRGCGNAGIGGSALGAGPRRFREAVYWVPGAAAQANRCQRRSGAGPAHTQTVTP